MGFLVACDGIPAAAVVVDAAVGARVPGREDMRVVEGLLDLEKDFFVIRVAEFRERKVKKGCDDE